MAGLLPSFLSSAQLEIRIGSTVLAYAQNIAWTDDMTNTAVGGIGSYSNHALEPVAYMGRGSMAITHYSSKIFKGVAAIPGGAGGAALPENLRGTAVQADRDGNSLLTKEFFNPIQMLLSRTFDINIYERLLNTAKNAVASGDTSRLIWTLKDCRMTNLSIQFTPGTLVTQNVSFLCMSTINHTVEDSFKYALPKLS